MLTLPNLFVYLNRSSNGSGANSACSYPMKWLLFILLLTGYGCKKCAECTTTYTQKVTGQQPVTSTSTQEMCGDDLKEADGYYNTATSTVNGHTAVITTSIECN